MSKFWKVYLSIVTSILLIFAGMIVFNRTHAQSGPYSTSMHTGLWVMQDAGTPCHISSGTTTTCKATSGSVMLTVLGTGLASGTIKFYDVAGGSCSGTPGSGLVASLTFPLTLTNPDTIYFNMNMVNGICVVTSGVVDITVIYN